MENEQGAAEARGDLGRRVAQRRSELGITREELAERAGMAPGYVAYLEANPPVLTRSALYRLARALRTSPEHLTGGDTDVPPGVASTAVPRPELLSLTREECLDLISRGGVGRLAFTDGEGSAPTILPVNYAVAEGDVLFRTEAEGEIARHVPGPVGFEVDRFDDTMSEGWSVLVTGRARIVREEEGAPALWETAPIRPWAGGERETYVRVVADEVTGRRVRAGGPR